MAQDDFKRATVIERCRALQMLKKKSSLKTKNTFNTSQPTLIETRHKWKSWPWSARLTFKSANILFRLFFSLAEPN